MNKIYPIKEIDIYDIDNLLKLVNDNSLFLFDKEKTDFINETFNHYGYLTYDQLVDIICYFHSTRNNKDNYLKEDSINNRETAIELLSHYYPYNKTFALAARPSNLTDESDLNLSSIKYLWPKALGIIELTNKIRESYYLVNYVEESLKVILDTRFDGNQIVNGIVNNDNEYEGLSNSLLVIEYALLIIFTFLKFDLNSKGIYIMRLVITSCIFLTFVVFGFILTPASLASGEYNPFTISSIFQHLIAPPRAILEFILLDPNKEKKNKLLCLHSLDISIIYIVFILIRGAINNYPHVRTGDVYSKCPYFLFDPYFMGYFFEGGELNVNFGVVPIIAILIIINILLGFVLVISKNKVDSITNIKSII